MFCQREIEKENERYFPTLKKMKKKMKKIVYAKQNLEHLILFCMFVYNMSPPKKKHTESCLSVIPVALQVCKEKYICVFSHWLQF